MEKPKILELRDTNYSLGNIIFLRVEINKDLHKSMISFLSDLEFPESALENFDQELLEEDFFIFSFEKDIRISFFNGREDNEAILLIDSPFEKDFLMKKLEKFFNIF